MAKKEITTKKAVKNSSSSVKEKKEEKKLTSKSSSTSKKTNSTSKSAPKVEKKAVKSEKKVDKKVPAKKGTKTPVEKKSEKKIEKTVPISPYEEVAAGATATVMAEHHEPLKQEFKPVDSRLPKAFHKYQELNGRIYLSNPKTYGHLPDLLSLQKKGYNDFLQYYLPTLFEEMNPIRDLGGNKLNITITDVQVSEPAVDIDTCKKKEQTYGGIITAKIKLSEKIVDEKTKKESEKVLFNKRANVGTLPLMTPTATYIVNGVERVVISQIVRSYGIFYSPKEVNRCSFKVIPENGPWLEVDVEKAGTIVGRINKSRKFPITSLLKIYLGDFIEQKIIENVLTEKISDEDIEKLKNKKKELEKNLKLIEDNIKECEIKQKKEREKIADKNKSKKSKLEKDIKKIDEEIKGLSKLQKDKKKKLENEKHELENQLKSLDVEKIESFPFDDKLDELINEKTKIEKELKEIEKDLNWMISNSSSEKDLEKGNQNYGSICPEYDEIKKLIDSKVRDNYSNDIKKLSARHINAFINDRKRRAEALIEMREDSHCARLLKEIYDFEIENTFSECFDEEDINYIDITLKKDKETYDAISAAELIYNKLRPGEIIDAESALDYVKAQFMDPNRIKVGRIARRKINAKLGLKKPLGSDLANIFDAEDLVAALTYLLNLCNHKKGYYIDDSDHLSNKRIRTMGEVLYSHLQPVMRKFVKSVGGKLSVLNTENSLKITDLVNFKMIDNAIKSFFATSQLSQFLDQINPLSEIEHKRRITALGPGGLKRETAKFEVRDVHASHYGRICPIETPEGQNIGLVTHQALYSRINEEGFLETPALKIFRQVSPKKSELVHRIAHRDICELDGKGNETKKVIVSEDSYIDEKQAEAIEKFYGKSGAPIRVKPFFTDEIEYISPEMDEKTVIADATSPVDEWGNIKTNRVAARHFTEMSTFHINEVTHMDVNLSQIFSPNVAVIPFVDHNDAVRASISTSQQRQAVPLLRNEAPLVGTGKEKAIMAMTNAVITAEADGEVIYVDGKRVKVKYKEGTKEYELITFLKSNNKTAMVQCPCVHPGQKVKKGDLLAEGPSAVNGEMSLGTNIRIAFMPWKGYNYEDAIVVSQRLVRNDTLTSMHIEEHEIEVAETKLGPEETTNDIPGVSLAKLSNLDDEGIIRIGSIVKGGDILIGKITPKSEGELTPEEKLIQAIFGDKSKNVKDTSLYLPSGSEGKVIDVVILDAKKGDNLMAGVKKKIKVYVAMTRKIEVGDKLAGRHGNKGIVSIVVPEEDMPYSADGQPIDIVLNSLGVISRMNLGQLFETQLGFIAKSLGIKFAVPTFGDFGINEMLELADEIGFKDKLETTLYDGQTGEPYEQKVTVGYMHIIKLVHMVEDKIHARSVGPYSLITQQPLGGKSRQGGQRFGEMEVWALEAYSAVYTLQEMLTVKSDDVIGRNKLYESIIKGQKPKIGGLPESFNLLTYLFRGIGQNIQPLTADEIERIQDERIEKIKSLGLSGLMSEMSIPEENGGEVDSNEEKEEIMDKVTEDLEDFGQTE